MTWRILLGFAAVWLTIALVAALTAVIERRRQRPIVQTWYRWRSTSGMWSPWLLAPPDSRLDSNGVMQVRKIELPAHGDQR